MIVLGNATFFADAHVDMLGNRDFFLGIVTWLSQRESVFGGTAPAGTAPMIPGIELTAGRDRLFFWLAVVVQPAAAFFMGALIVLWRRYKM